MIYAQPIVRKLARRLAWIFPELDVDELIGDVQPVVVRCVRDHNPKKASLKTWVHRNVWWYFTSKAPSKKWRRRMAKSNPMIRVLRPAKFNVQELMKDLSDKACLVVQLVLTQDLGQTELLHVLKALQGLGWEREAIVQVFQEVRDAL